MLPSELSCRFRGAYFAPLNFRVTSLRTVVCSACRAREEVGRDLIQSSCVVAPSRRLKSACSFFSATGEQPGKRDAGSRRKRGKSLSKNQGTASAPRRSQFPGRGGNAAPRRSRVCLAYSLACLPALNSHASIRVSQRAYPRTAAP